MFITSTVLTINSFVYSQFNRSIENMSQSSVYSQRQIKWQPKPLITYDCQICVTTNTDQLLELPCGHNVNRKIPRKKIGKTNLFLNSYVYHVYI